MNYRNTSFLLLLGLLSACGRTSRLGGNFNRQYNPYPPLGSSTVQFPVAGAPVTVPAPSVAPSITAFPGITQTAGNAVFLTANYGSQTSFNFRFESTPAGVSFLDQVSGVQQVRVTSTQAANVTVIATPVGSTTPEARITLTFTGSTTPVASSMTCNLAGPYQVSSYYGVVGYFNGSPKVGEKAFFQLSSAQGDNLKVTRLWTLDSRELGNYYSDYSNFTIPFWSSGSKTIFVRAESLSRYGATCDAQITINVDAAATATNTCGLITRTLPSGMVCSLATTQTFYFNGSSCQEKWSSCTEWGPFNSLSACQQAVNSGSCTNSTYTPPPAPVRQVWLPANTQSCTSVCQASGMRSIPYTNGSYCASGEVRPAGVSGINYLYGTWGSGTEFTAAQSVGGYCYGSKSSGAQKQDNDATDKTIACYCSD